MNAPAHIPATLPVWLSNDFQFLACTWRGACVELFGRAECAISDTIETLASSGHQLPSECRHEAPRKRAAGLMEFITGRKFAGYEKPARKELERWLKLLDKRNQIIHSTISGEDGLIVCKHHIYDAKNRKETQFIHSWQDALFVLNELDEAFLKLRNSLNQIAAQAQKAGS